MVACQDMLCFDDVYKKLIERSEKSPSVFSGKYLEETRKIWRASEGRLVSDAVEVEIEGLRAVWVRPEQYYSDKRALFIHGGGFVFGSPETHFHFVKLLADKIGMSILVPDYRLAPEFPYPNALEDVMKAVDYVTRHNMASENQYSKIAVLGDSAGGNLALSLGLSGASEHIYAIALFSPWVDLSQGALWREDNRQKDAVLNPERLNFAANSYADYQIVESHSVSPIFGNLRTLPPCLIEYGYDELLGPDIERFYKKALAEKANVKVKGWFEVVHAWHLFGAKLPQGLLAIEEVASFLMRLPEKEYTNGA